jgi:hypothetical protein
VEVFSVNDLDNTLGDNNKEDGNATTFSYRYTLTKGSYIQTEYNYIKSARYSRLDYAQPLNLTEQQLQLAFRQFF